jgi:tRNA (adenine57-N1/adenine58-N1)-methyltransferase
MNRNDVVLDAGTGSGIAAIFFGGIALKVVTYEAREDFARIAAENISEAGLENVEVIAGDVLSAEGAFDVVHYDMTIGPDHVRHAHALLRPGGYLACYTPFIEHLCGVMDTAEGLFSSVKAVECIEREMTRSKRGTRPSTRVGHSGYLTIARK